MRQLRQQNSGSPFSLSLCCLDVPMHPLFNQASAITLGAASEVHKDKGPGLLESVYEWCLTTQLGIRGYQVDNQSEVVIRYKQFQRTVPLRFD